MNVSLKPSAMPSGKSDLRRIAFKQGFARLLRRGEDFDEDEPLLKAVGK